ncbi:MAG TPA: DUF1134 domain-containing protein [Allosphingosinicella sp.]|jgi:hypothetical protein
MRIPTLLKILAAAGLAAAQPAAAQVQTVDPNQAVEQAPPAGTPQEAAPAPELQTAPQTEAAAPANASKRASDATERTLSKQKVLAAAESTFGKGAEGLADMIEDLLRDQGEPSAYITGREAGGAFVLGVRYGSGTIHHGIEGDRPIYWTGPSLGFDFGADANKVFVLVYNLHDSQRIFRRYAAAEGNAYVVGGFTASYMRRGDVVLIPVRLGVGARLGVNAGYMNFSQKSRLLPF